MTWLFKIVAEKQSKLFLLFHLFLFKLTHCLNVCFVFFYVCSRKTEKRKKTKRKQKTAQVPNITNNLRPETDLYYLYTCFIIISADYLFDSLFLFIVFLAEEHSTSTGLYKTTSVVRNNVRPETSFYYSVYGLLLFLF